MPIADNIFLLFCTIESAHLNIIVLSGVYTLARQNGEQDSSVTNRRTFERFGTVICRYFDGHQRMFATTCMEVSTDIFTDTQDSNIIVVTMLTVLLLSRKTRVPLFYVRL